MAISVLSVGIPAKTKYVPPQAQDRLQAVLTAMEEDMRNSPYDFDIFYMTPDDDFNLFLEKLRSKKFDLVHVGVGVRKIDALTPFFENIVNAVHEELPKAKMAFCIEIDKTQEACRRVLPP